MQEDKRWVRVPAWLWAAMALSLMVGGLYWLRGVFTPIFFAFLMAYFLDPVVDKLEARKVPRALGIVLLLVVALVALGLFLFFLLPSVVREVLAFAQELPRRLSRLQATVEPWIRAQGLPVPHSLDELVHLVESQARSSDDGAGLPSAELAGGAASVLQWIGRFVWGGTASAISILSTLLLVPVFAFYLLHDFDSIVSGTRNLVPRRYRVFVVDVAREVDEVLSAFVRGQILVMLALALLYSVGYSLVGIRLAVPIGITAGMLAFIPYVGGAYALVMGLFMAVLNWQGWEPVVGICVVYGVVQLLEGFFITPRIVGDKVGLSAVWVLIALMAGGELFGFLGVLLALPVAAVGKIFVVRVLAWYRKTEFFLAAVPATDGALVQILEEEGLPDSPELIRAKARLLVGTDDEASESVNADSDTSTSLASASDSLSAEVSSPDIDKALVPSPDVSVENATSSEEIQVASPEGVKDVETTSDAQERSGDPQEAESASRSFEAPADGEEE